MVPLSSAITPCSAGDVGLLRAALFEFLAQEALRLLGAGEDDDSARCRNPAGGPEAHPSGRLAGG